MALQRKAGRTRRAFDECLGWVWGERLPEERADPFLRDRVAEVEKVDDAVEEVLAEAFRANQPARPFVPLQHDGAIAELARCCETGEPAAEHEDIAVDGGQVFLTRHSEGT